MLCRHTSDNVSAYEDTMESSFARAQHYRDQSNRMHELAAKEDNHEAKTALSDLALMYARLCEKYLANSTLSSVTQGQALPRAP